MSSTSDIELSTLTAGLNVSNGNEDGSDETYFPFLELPKKVVDRILDCLNVWSLMDLRMVCKETKKWTEERCLQKFALHIKSHSQMEEDEFKRSEILWSHVVIRCDALNNDINWIQNPLYSQLLNKLSGSLETLKLNDHRLPYVGLRSILYTCKSLKCLEIGTLSCAGWVEEDEDSEDWLKIAKSCHNLDTLCICFVAWNAEEELDLFKSILIHCSKLTYLKVPHVLMAALFQNDVDEDEIDRRYLAIINSKLVDPLLDFLRRVQSNVSDCDTDNNVPVMRRYLDVENIHHSEIFPRVAQACFQTGTKLLNVSEAFDDTIPDSEIVNLQAIESLSGFTKYLNFKDLTNLKSIALDSETSADSEINDKSITAPIPSLKSISFCLPDDISRNILTCFVKHRRENVISIMIEFQVDEPVVLSHLFKISDFAQNYKHLQHLTFIDWSGKDDDLILILTSLTSLQSLKLQSCPKITDRGFLGKNPAEPVLLNLKELKDLWIDCQISNAVLKYAVRHLALESLFYSSDRVTLQGFLSLTQGPLTTSLISLPVIQPEDCTTEILMKFLGFFKNLKRKPISSSVKFNIST